MLQILGHPHLPHQSVFVSIHTCQMANMTENVLETVSQLERLNLTESVLNMGVYHQFHQFQNFTAQMEGITEPRFLSLFCGQRLYWF
jgi:hypothetical protein